MHPLYQYLIDTVGSGYSIAFVAVASGLGLGISLWIVAVFAMKRERALVQGVHDASDAGHQRVVGDMRHLRYMCFFCGGICVVLAAWAWLVVLSMRDYAIDRAKYVMNPDFRLQGVVLQGPRIQIDGMSLPEGVVFTYANQPTFIEGMTIPPTEVSFQIPTTEAIRIMREMRAMGMAVPKPTGTDGV
jgi:hypothetical protein